MNIFLDTDSRQRFILTLATKHLMWNNLDPHLRNSENFVTFKNNILNFIRPKPNSFFNCCNLKGIRLITRLRLDSSFT